MNKKSVMAILIASILLFSLVATLFVKVTEANPFYFCYITIHSPQNGSNPSQPVQVNFTTVSSHQILSPQSIFYTVDKENKQLGINVTQIQPLEDPTGWDQYSGQIQLKTLSNGIHNVTVYWGNQLDDGTLYTIDTPSYSGATTTFIIGNTTMSPSESPTPAPLMIDLANGNYINDVTVDQPVDFSAVVSNGVRPYTFQWYYRQYYVGSAVGDVYPIGDAMLGSDSQNFTFTANSTGHYLISLGVWDSAGAEGYFMSIPNPGIWVNAVAPTPTPSPTISPTPSPSTTPSLTPTLSPNMTPSSSPTQQPALELSPTSDNIQVENYAPMIILAGLVVIAASVSLVVYLKRRR